MSNHISWSDIRDEFLADVEDVVPTHASCQICRWYYARYDEGGVGDCRRHSPSPTWPLVRSEHICGDWETDYQPVLR